MERTENAGLYSSVKWTLSLLVIIFPLRTFKTYLQNTQSVEIETKLIVPRNWYKSKNYVKNATIFLGVDVDSDHTVL